ncbi:MAG: SWIM zinc finger family protein [Holosporales bacterium]|jgi:uncharacterized Zn finger protein
MSWGRQWGPYVPVAKRRADAQKKMEKLRKQGQEITPVVIEGRTIAKSFWGKSWCENLENYSDYESRLPRGRTYVRNGSVADLQVRKGEITALVSGSEIYKISIKIKELSKDRWTAICKDAAGSVGSLVELLQGKLSQNVMERVCRKGDGLFPSPKEITLSCSCPDWADMCKHVAAALYGVGARLDQQPELLFTLRAVNENELIAAASNNIPMADTAKPDTGRVMADDDMAALFGINMEDAVVAAAPTPKKKTTTTIVKKTKPSVKPVPSPAAKKRGRPPKNSVVAKTPAKPKKAGAKPEKATQKVIQKQKPPSTKGIIKARRKEL